MKLVLVTWEDASAEAGPWVDAEALPELPVKVFRQVGWLVSRTRSEIVLSQAVEVGGKGLMAARERIPRGMVRSLIELDPVGTPITTRKPRKDTNA